MAVNYLHGVETITIQRGPRAVNVVKSAVIALVGAAPQGPKQELTIVQTAQDAAQFGFWHKDNTLSTALSAILQQGGALCLVVNVFDEDSHTESITENITVNNNRARLTRLLGKGVVSVVVGANTLVLDTDYEWNAARQEIRILDTTTYPDGTVLAVSFDAVNVASIANADILGAVTAGVRTGLELYDEAYNAFGMVPKILCIPRFSQEQTIANAMLSKADKYKAIALLDAPSGALPAEAISGRGSSAGTVKNFFTSSKRAYLLYPQIKIEDLYTSAVTGTVTDVVMPYSQFMAGVISRVDSQEGYHVSPSNKELRGIKQPERTLTFMVNDAFTEVNLLNEKGITTIAQSFGTGYRTFGNRSAAFPVESTPDNFVPVQRTADIIHESLEFAMFQFIDRPLLPATIDSILETANAFLRTLQGRGVIVDGEVTFDPAKNPPTQLGNGHVVFDIEFMPPTPAERITFESFINIELLRALTA